MFRFLLQPFLLLFVISGIASCASSRTAAQSSGDEAQLSPKELLKEINAVRARGCNCGGSRYPPVPPVKWNNHLENVAVTQSRYMQRTGQLKHTGANGATLQKRVSNAGYRWSYVAENIAMGQRTTPDVVQAWIQSPGHCRNIMSASVSEIGAAVSDYYWTLVLAAPQ
ncbi:SCP-like extracellular protein [Niabella ginsenosidivorans]|uniref:SCP-like extracellular protein n=1 Tax=Niabella ginsenosidivorans TaxID=1176587 RepID=A0A1A9I5H1_9BACT|nr:CAP domain-containing protein [Niabella ginsenosidivorans]ANH81932.1 SCP-like extracellular protein [Niabella ginsenosidivorans]